MLTVSIERLPEDHPTIHRWRTVFRNPEGAETSVVDSQSIGTAIIAIADQFGYDLPELESWREGGELS